MSFFPATIYQALPLFHLFLPLHASLVAQRLKCLPAMRETWVRFLGQEDPLEKEMATHSSTLAWRIPWTEELGGLQSMGSQRVGHDWATSLTHSLIVCVFINLLCDWFSETVGNNEMAEYRLWNLIDLGLNSPSSLLIPGRRPQILRFLISEQGQWFQPHNGDLRTKWENPMQSIYHLATTSAL